MDFITLILYIILSLLIVFIAKISIDDSCYNIKVGSKTHKMIFFNAGYLFLTSILVFFAVFRYVYNGYGGTDAYSYVLEYQNFKGSFIDYFKMERFLYFWKYSETLFKIITLFFRSLSEDYHLYFLFNYGLIVMGLLSFVYNVYDKQSNFLTLILLFCSYLHSYNVMRGWMSISICMFALISLKEKQWKKSLLIVLLATFFHTMALTFILVWLACWIDFRYPHFFTRRRLWCIVLLTNLAFFLGKNIFIILIMSTKYAYYIDWFKMPVSIIGYIPTFLICAGAIFMYPKLKKRGGYASTSVIILAINLSLLYCIVYLVGWRIHDYFAPVRMYMLSEFYTNATSYFKEKKLVKILITIYIVALFVQSLHGLFESSNVFPYILDI